MRSAWIEIFFADDRISEFPSRAPCGARGLKSYYIIDDTPEHNVALHAERVD